MQREKSNNDTYKKEQKYRPETLFRRRLDLRGPGARVDAPSPAGRSLRALSARQQPPSNTMNEYRKIYRAARNGVDF